MKRVRAGVIGVAGVTILGLTGCSLATDADESGRSAYGQATGTQHMSPDEPCPESLRVSLDEAMLLGSVLPAWFPSHPYASVETVVGVCAEPGGNQITFLFRSPHPPDAPLRFDGISMTEMPWDGGDPLTDYQETIARFPEQEGKRIHTVSGVPALSDAAHDGDEGDDPAWLELVLEDVRVMFWGGESVEDLIAIAETLDRLEPEPPLGPS